MKMGSIIKCQLLLSIVALLISSLGVSIGYILTARFDSDSILALINGFVFLSIIVFCICLVSILVCYVAAKKYPEE